MHVLRTSRPPWVGDPDVGNGSSPWKVENLIGIKGSLWNRYDQHNIMIKIINRYGKLKFMPQLES